MQGIPAYPFLLFGKVQVRCARNQPENQTLLKEKQADKDKDKDKVVEKSSMAVIRWKTKQHRGAISGLGWIGWDSILKKPSGKLGRVMGEWSVDQ